MPRRLLAEESGAVAFLGAAVMFVAVGVGALAIDGGNLYLNRVKLQAAADAAALAAVQELADPVSAAAVAVEVARLNMAPEKYGEVLEAEDVVLGTWNRATRTFTPGAGGNAARVTTRRAAGRGNPVGMFLATVFGTASLDLATTAVARAGGSGPCILALEASGSNAIRLDSNARITATDCTVHANSSSSTAITALSNSHLRSRETRVVGGHSGSSSRYDPQPVKASVTPDPLAGRAPPEVGGCTHNNHEIDSKTATLSPGVYCGGITLKGNANVTFAPGEYIIRNGSFFVDSNSVATGSGVGFYLTSTTSTPSTLHFTSNTSISFSAPTSGPLAGLLFFEDRNAPVSGLHRLDSNNISRLEGTIYLSRGTLSLDSNSVIASASAFTNIVARRVWLDSNAELRLNANYSNSAVPNALATPRTLVN